MVDKRLRKAFYEDVITFPATKAAGVATITGDVVALYEANTFGATTLLISALDGDAVTDDLTITSYGSWDGGTTYYAINEDETLTGGADGAISSRVSLGSLIPRIRVDGIFDAFGALTATHGAQVDLVVEEEVQSVIKEITAATTIAANLAGATTQVTAALSLATPAHLDYAGIVIIVPDSSNITVGTTIGYKVQTSIDNVRWFDLAADVTNGLVVVDTNGPVYIEVEYTEGLGKYVRVALTGTDSSALAKANMVVYGILS